VFDLLAYRPSLSCHSAFQSSRWNIAPSRILYRNTSESEGFIMIDPATGMKAGERYIVESLERTRHFPGFFLDGKYYLGPELMTAIGWLEGQQFYYDELDPTGEPVFPNRLAGTVEDLTLILADGARLPLNEMPYEAEIDSSDVPISRNPSSSGHRPAPTSDQHGAEGVRMSGKHPYPILLAAGAALLLGILFGVKQAKRLPIRKLR
jgi:hypothetical protein